MNSSFKYCETCGAEPCVCKKPLPSNISELAVEVTRLRSAAQNLLDNVTSRNNKEATIRRSALDSLEYALDEQPD